MALSDVFSFGVNSILQCSGNTQSLLYGEVDVLFDIPLIGLFKAVRFESYPFHVAILLCKIAVSSRKQSVGSRKLEGVFFNRGFHGWARMMNRVESWKRQVGSNKHQNQSPTTKRTQSFD
jgi:hypothetical protein